MINFQKVGTFVFWKGLYPYVTTKPKYLVGQSLFGLILTSISWPGVFYVEPINSLNIFRSDI